MAGVAHAKLPRPFLFAKRDDMMISEKRAALEAWIHATPGAQDGIGDSRDLNEAAYTASETGYFGEFELDGPTAYRIWRLVEAVRLNGFPRELKM